MATKPVYTNVMDKSLETMKDVLRPILNRDVNLSIVEVVDASAHLLSTTFDDDPVMVEAPIEGAVADDQFYFFSKKLAAAITDLMVMGDGTAEFSEHESLDGVAEAINQIVGAQSTLWGAELKTDLHPGGSQANVAQISELTIDDGRFVAVILKIEIEDWGEENFIYFGGVQLFDMLSALVEPQGRQRRSSGGGGGGAEGGDAGMMEEAGMAGMASGGGGGGRGGSRGGAGPDVRRAEFSEFDMDMPFDGDGAGPKNLDLLMDISLPVTIELGRTEMLIREVLELGPGSVIELQKLSGEPVDLYINDKRFALGEVVVIDENFGIRITELLSVEDRIKALK